MVGLGEGAKKSAAWKLKLSATTRYECAVYAPMVAAPTLAAITVLAGKLRLQDT